MALVTATDFNSIELERAYIRVDRIFGGKQEGSYGSVVGVYASQTAAEAGKPYLEASNFSVPYVAEEHPYKLLYEGLKADKYPEAGDC